MPAKSFMQTDIFKYFEDSGAGMQKRIGHIIGDPKAAVVINQKMEPSLTRLAQTIRETIVLKAIMAVRSGDLVLFYATPEFNLPECLPFFRYAKPGDKKGKVAVNMTNIASHAEATSESPEEYVVEDMRKLYCMLVAAYINLKCPDPADYPVKSMEFGARMWATHFCKILNSTIGLSTSRDRYTAFYYYAARFYLLYYIGAPLPTTDSISKALLKGVTQNMYIDAIGEILKDPKQNQAFYGSFTGFCTIMFNNEMTNTKALRMAMASPGEKLNVSFYLRKYIDSYYQSAVLALASAHYFTWLLLCVQKRAFMVNIKMLGNVLDANTEIAKFMAPLFTEVEARP